MDLFGAVLAGRFRKAGATGRSRSAGPTPRTRAIFQAQASRPRRLNLAWRWSWHRPNAAAPASLRYSSSCSCRILRRTIFAIPAGLARDWRSTTCCFAASRRAFLGHEFRLLAYQRGEPATPSRLSDTNNPRTQRQPVDVGEQHYCAPLQRGSIRWRCFSPLPIASPVGSVGSGLKHVYELCFSSQSPASNSTTTTSPPISQMHYPVRTPLRQLRAGEFYLDLVQSRPRSP